MAQIEFSRGTVEESIPDVRVTRSKNGGGGTATFIFDNPKILTSKNSGDVTGMYLIDEEGEIMTREVKGKYVNGQPRSVEAILIMNSEDEFNRFIRFMNRYAEEHGLGLTKS
ncbi:photosystem II reaction center protein Psb28 [Oscillatoria salina]|uniref:photosystem II reaction center protein Psb28 n=1 Tax=Oscillatoria salina TaxID=331517 RepID=UPI0013B6DAFF|nr:photosystem II reaction center protein Psb28 [Oscillatoria salina]MBZ8181548.1 photosystem II reaction center protein Psb28 [Oscillatoria salina IIICB1]NET89272.1 photosystem II reaction center protein Psb28 [Kamptonema sp. SIO1D9]